MKNKGTTELRLWVKDGKVVGPHVANATEVIVGPGEDITAELTPEQVDFYTKTGHIAEEAA